MITITCPHCGFSGKAPESAAGKQAKCRQCSKFFSVPSGHDAIPTGPIGNAVTVMPDVHEFEFSEPQNLVQYTPNDPEPWYYSFISGYTVTFMLFAIAFVLIYAVADLPRFRGSQPATDTIRHVAFFMIRTFLEITFILFAGALLLLAVDEARNIREIRKRRR